ncbi:MAG: FG-GAP repeat domain-containing protein, partial [Thermoanaerobaculia bacterium]
MKLPLRISPLLLFLAAAAAPAQMNQPPARPGFPVILAGAGAVKASSPAVGDLDNDGVQEIVVGTANRRVYVLNANGTVRAGWPVTMPGEIGAAPSLGDVDRDGFLDVVVASGSSSDPTSAGAVRAYRRDGTVIWSFSPLDTNGDSRPDGVVSTPAIGDVDGDGAPEVAFGSWDFNIYLLRGSNGTVMPGFPPNPSGLGMGMRDSIWSSPALADLDRDGKLEIIIGVDTHAEGPPVNTPNGGGLYVFRWNGTLFPGWPQFVDQTIMSSPAIGDLDGDGFLDIVVGGGVFWPGAVGRKVYAWNRNGAFLPGWPVSTVGQVFNSPALADLDLDGRPDVIVSDEPNGGQEPYLYAFASTGTPLWQMRPRSFFAVTPNLGNPVVADV